MKKLSYPSLPRMGPFMVLITVQSRESPRSPVCPLPQAIHLCLEFLYGSALWAEAVFNNKKCHEELTDVGILSQKSVKKCMHFFFKVEVDVFQLGFFVFFFKCVKWHFFFLHYVFQTVDGCFGWLVHHLNISTDELSWNIQIFVVPRKWFLMTLNTWYFHQCQSSTCQYLASSFGAAFSKC